MCDFECKYRSQCKADGTKKNLFAWKRKLKKCNKDCGKRLAIYIGSLDQIIDWSRVGRSKKN